MKKLTAGIFAAILTVVTVNAAHANIASEAYVNDKFDGLAEVAKTGSYEDLKDTPDLEKYLSSDDLSELQGNVSSLQDDVSSLSGDVSSLQGDVSSLSSLSGDVSSLQSDVSSLQGEVSSLQSDVAGKQETLSEDQLKAVNSGITADLVNSIRGSENCTDCVLKYNGSALVWENITRGTNE